MKKITSFLVIAFLYISSFAMAIPKNLKGLWRVEGKIKAFKVDYYGNIRFKKTNSTYQVKGNFREKKTGRTIVNFSYTDVQAQGNKLTFTFKINRPRGLVQSLSGLVNAIPPKGAKISATYSIIKTHFLKGSWKSRDNSKLAGRGKWTRYDYLNGAWYIKGRFQGTIKRKKIDVEYSGKVTIKSSGANYYIRKTLQGGKKYSSEFQKEKAKYRYNLLKMTVLVPKNIQKSFRDRRILQMTYRYSDKKERFVLASSVYWGILEETWSRKDLGGSPSRVITPSKPKLTSRPNEIEKIEYFTNAKVLPKVKKFYQQGKKTRELEYYENGRIKRQTFYDQAGLQEGMEILYYNSKKSNIKSKTSYHVGVRDGEYTTYTSRGYKKVKGFYKKNRKDGQIISYYHGRDHHLLGKFAKVENYVNGKKNGKYLEYDVDGIEESSGNLEIEYQYKNGKIEGLQKEYWSDGNIRRTFTCKNGKMEGIDWGFYKNGKIRYKVTYKNGKKEGLYLKLTRQGYKEEEIFYKNNLKSGKSILYFHRGNSRKYFGRPAKIEFYINGKLEGKQQEYYSENRKLKKEYFYQNGKLEGIYTEYWLGKGNLKKEFHYRTNKLNGIQKAYWENGGLQSTKEYKNGQYDGVNRFYSKRLGRNGKTIVLLQKNWHQGKLHGVTRAFYENGKLEERIEYKNGQKDGLQATYYENGRMKFCKEYLQGYQNGIQVQWRSNGRLLSEATYNHGTSVYYIQYKSDGRTVTLEKGKKNLRKIVNIKYLKSIR